MKLHQWTLFLDISLISLQVSRSAATSSLTSSFSSLTPNLPLLLCPWGVPTHSLLLFAKRLLHQYVKSTLPPVSLAHTSTVLRVRQGETKIPLKICLSDNKNTKPKLISTATHFMGASNALTTVQAVSPEWNGSKLQVRPAVSGAEKKLKEG